MYTLYHYPFSQHARRVVSLLEEASLPYQLRHVAMDEEEHYSPDFLAINPNHQIPVLQDADFYLYESNAIMRYLARKHHLTQWYPEDCQARALVDQWLDWIQIQMSPAVIDIVKNSVFLGADGDQAAVMRGQQRLGKILAILENTLQDKDYLVTTEPTLADLSLASNIYQLSFAGIRPDTPGLTAWYQRLAILPGFIRSLPKETE